LILVFQTIVAVVLNNCEITGAANFKKLNSNNTEASLNGDKQFTIGSVIELTNLRINVNYYSLVFTFKHIMILILSIE
jgi:hypothetical protein